MPLTNEGKQSNDADAMLTDGLNLLGVTLYADKTMINFG